MISNIVCPPQSWEQFAAQDYPDSEWTRRYIPGTTKRYARGAHYAYDNQHLGGSRDLFAVGIGRIEHVNFGPSLGARQFVLRFLDDSGYFYAHTASRIADGAVVEPGEYVGTMGDSSNMNIGVHLHHEYLEDWNNWYSSRNQGAQLRLLKEQKGMLSSNDLDKLRNIIEYRIGQSHLRTSAALIAELGDAEEPAAKSVLKQMADAHKVVGDKFILDSKK